MRTNAITPEERLEIRRKTAKPLLWLGIVSMIMLFAGLTSAYVVSKGSASDEFWFNFDFPVFFWISSGIILLSSLTMNMASNAAKKDDQKGMRTGLLLTMVLGLGFCATQWFGWAELYAQKIHLVGDLHSNAGKYLYFISGLHIVHLFGGLLSLSVTIKNASKLRYSSSNYIGLQLCALYWHFLDILWIYLCLFFWFIH